MDTIFALSSGAGRAGVSIIRVSGAAALDACRSLGAALGDHDRRVVRLIDPQGALIDEAFALSFAPGRSFTGEQVVELHTHGSTAIVSAVLNRLGDLGLRQAEPGEFTRRAMENGRLDLAQVEGLADLIDAETESQRRQAVRVFSGELGGLADGWRRKLIRAAALLEATIDFVDEDVPVDVYPEVQHLLGAVEQELEREASGVRIRERVREGFEVALVGRPNSGKSTLLNRLAGREAALTSNIAGTTRDVIEVRMDLAGFPVTVLDTAGLRASTDILEEMGIARGQARAEQADVRVHLLEAGEELPVATGNGLDVFLLAKGDLAAEQAGISSISGLTGQGVDGLLDVIASYLAQLTSGAGVATRVRHQKALVVAASALRVAQDGLLAAAPVDLVAEDLRTAIRALDSLIGRVDVENVLSEIFASFCIGK